jgi:hypothetical protein
VNAGTYSVSFNIQWLQILTGGTSTSASLNVIYGVSNASSGAFASGSQKTFISINKSYNYPVSGYNNNEVFTGNFIINTTSFGSTSLNLNILIPTNAIPNSETIAGYTFQACRIA